MARTDRKWCRICLSNNEDDNISHASRYAEFLYQLTSNKHTEEIWLCMWCRTILQKTITLKRLALTSEQLLLSQNEVPYGLQNNKHIPRLSYTSVIHINVPSDYNDKENSEIMILNESNNINDENITSKIVQQSVDSMQNLGMNDNLNEISLQNELNLNEVIIEEYNHSVDFLNEEIEYQNENVSLSQNMNKRPSENNELIAKQENENEYLVQQKEKKNKINKQMKLTKNNKKVSKKSKIDLKLEELKFEVRYLNLEEQIKEVELKKNKYKDKKYQCETCGVGFLTDDYFEQHKIRHTEAAGQHKCNICSLHFKTTLVLSQHLLSHKRKFSCTTCGARFGKWSNCVVHRQKCGATVLYVECETCHKVFSDAHSLKVHARLHRLQRQFSCEQCGASFTTKQKLAVHARSHSGVKPFSCPLCARRFTTNSNLRAHGAVHSSRPEHYCVQCDTRYKTAKSLNRHLRESARHARERSHLFKCTECGKEFPTKKSLQCHLARHSDGLQEIKCPQCDKSFSSKSNLSKHLKCIHKHVLTSADEK